jgi:hypothetical protein
MQWEIGLITGRVPNRGDEYTKNSWSPGGEYKVKSMMNKCNSNIRPDLENKFLDLFKEIERGC